MIDRDSMKATVVPGELYRALRQVKRSAAPEPGFVRPSGPRRRARIPVLTHVRLEVADNTLTVACTDLRVADVAAIGVTQASEGSFCVPVRLLTRIVGQLRDTGEQIRLAVRPATIAAWGSGDDYAQDKIADVLEISCGAATFRLIGLPASDFPIIDAIPGCDGFRHREEALDGAQV